MTCTPATGRFPRLVWLLVVASFLMAVACNPSPTPPANQSNTNQSTPPSSTSNTNSPSKPEQPKTGNIEIASSPSGARVLLVPDEESGAGEPQARGVTPATITGLAPGKYTVDLEKPGYRFFQKQVTVKAGGTAKVTATLRKQ